VNSQIGERCLPSPAWCRGLHPRSQIGYSHHGRDGCSSVLWQLYVVDKCCLHVRGMSWKINALVTSILYFQGFQTHVDTDKLVVYIDVRFRL
jgi:hypothetical protein